MGLRTVRTRMGTRLDDWATGGTLFVLMLATVPGCEAPLQHAADEEQARNGGVSALGSTCTDRDECGMGECVRYASRSGEIRGYCTTSCSDDSDCSDRVPECGVGPGGQKVCSEACRVLQDRTLDSYFPPEENSAACIDGVPTACSEVSGHCEACGCSTSERCDPSGECLPLSDEGGPCRADSDCRTANCGMYTGVCRTPLGSPCDITNCDLCLTSDDWSYCSRECGGQYGCGSDPCLGDVYEDFFYCRPRCDTLPDPSCPGSCGAADGEYYCDAGSHLVPPRPLGSICQTPANCESGSCYLTEICYEFIGCNTTPGYCTMTCTSDDECGTGLACVDVPCAADEPHLCGPMCLRTCESELPSPWEEPCETEDDVCRPRQRVADGSAVRVCDVKRPNDHYCQYDASCVSGRCESNVCVAAGGVANGDSCVDHVDCLSGVCSSGSCRGTALIGDPCVEPADCAAGTCCDGACCVE